MFMLQNYYNYFTIIYYDYIIILLLDSEQSEEPIVFTKMCVLDFEQILQGWMFFLTFFFLYLCHAKLPGNCSNINDWIFWYRKIQFCYFRNKNLMLHKTKFTICIQQLQRDPPSSLRKRTRKVSITWCHNNIHYICSSARCRFESHSGKQIFFAYFPNIWCHFFIFKSCN